MPRPQESTSEGLRMYDELIAVHTIMRRGAELVASALERLATGERPSIAALVRVARWQAEFVHHHHASEDEQLWPVLRHLFPGAMASLDDLTAQHGQLDAELKALSAAIDYIEGARRLNGQAALAAAVGIAAMQAGPAAANVRDTLVAHLDAEEPVLRELFPQTPPAATRQLRKAVISGAPRSGRDLVLGLLEDPDPATGCKVMMRDLPRPVRLLRPVLLMRYAATKASLGKQAPVLVQRKMPR